MTKILYTRSLRFWVAVGILIAMAPFALSAILGFVLLERGVIAPIHDVATRQSEQMVPLQRLHLLLQDALISVDEYVEMGDPRQLQAARHLRGEIEAGFARLVAQVAGDPTVATLLERAHASWTAASDDATRLLSVTPRAGDTAHLEAMQRFHGDLIATSDQLGVVGDQLAAAIADDHRIAVLTYERSIWLACLAGLVSLFAMTAGIVLIGRIIGGSVDRLVDGAARFAEGDRHHRIAIAVPPELRRVAEEFNRMIGRIHQSEEALADLARLDGLTDLANRRSFDTAFDEASVRLDRHGEPYCLLAMDIDHFKRINDSHGHPAGDEVLRAVASLTAATIRPVDRAFRIGGEEFAVLLPKTAIAEALPVAERLRAAAATLRVAAGGDEIGMTISIGLAAARRGAPPKAVMEAADAALYRAKADGRNRVVVADPMG